MAKLFKVDVSALSSHQERYEVLKLFENSFDTYPAWFEPDPLHMTFEYFEAFWEYDTSPPFPQIPDKVKIIEV